MRLTLRTSRGYGLNLTTQPLSVAPRRRTQLILTPPARADRAVEAARDDRGDVRNDRA